MKIIVKNLNKSVAKCYQIFMRERKFLFKYMYG